MKRRNGGSGWNRRPVFTAAILLYSLMGCREEAPLVPPEPRRIVATDGGEELRFAVIGHLYPIARPRPLEVIIAAINRENPDLVFILGDSTLEDSRVVSLFQEKLEGEVFFTPGNHELKKDRRESYLENVGYLEHFFSTEACNFVLLNSSAGLEENLAFLDRALAAAKPARPTVILTHHRIWDDTLLSREPYEHDKSYYFSEIYPMLRGRVDAIFAGNSKRQYFRDLKLSPNYGPQNLDNVYWADRVGGITGYSVGMGDGVPKAGFVIVEVVDGRLLLHPRSIAWDGRELVDPKLLQPNRRSRPPARKKAGR